MKAITTSGWGPRATLTVTDRKPPEPGPDDLLVAVKAASVNPKDWKLNLTAAKLASPLLIHRMPPLMGDDLAGVVLAAGDNVKDYAVGDKVYGMDMRLRTASLAEQAVIHQSCVARMPANLDFDEAAAVPLAALTALQGLRIGKAGQDSKVLIIGASGGVGSFAVQIARTQGCHVTAVCSSRNASLVRELGADEVIDYTQGDYRKNAGPFDLVFDVTSYETPASCARLMGENGYFVSTGGHARAIVGTKLSSNPRVRNVWVQSDHDDLEALRTMIESGQVKPVIDSRFPLEDTQQAYDRSRSGRARGKIVILVDSTS